MGWERGLHWAPSDLESLLWSKDGASCQCLPRLLGEESPGSKKHSFINLLIHFSVLQIVREQY